MRRRSEAVMGLDRGLGVIGGEVVICCHVDLGDHFASGLLTPRRTMTKSATGRMHCIHVLLKMLSRRHMYHQR